MKMLLLFQFFLGHSEFVSKETRLIVPPCSKAGIRTIDYMIIITTFYVLNVFIDIQTSKELIQVDTDKMMTYGTSTVDDEKLTQS